MSSFKLWSVALCALAVIGLNASDVSGSPWREHVSFSGQPRGGCACPEIGNIGKYTQDNSRLVAGVFINRIVFDRNNQPSGQPLVNRTIFREKISREEYLTGSFFSLSRKYNEFMGPKRNLKRFPHNIIIGMLNNDGVRQLYKSWIELRSICGRFSMIFDSYLDDKESIFVRPLFITNHLHIYDFQPSSLVGDRHIPSNLVGFNRSPGSFLGFLRHIGSVISSPPRVMEGSYDSDQGGKRENNGRNRCPKHAFCPESHVLLGLQISYFVLFLPLCLGSVFLGYRVANRGFDSLEGGKVVNGWLWLCAAGGLAVGSAFLLPWLGYWLLFEGGMDFL